MNISNSLAIYRCSWRIYKFEHIYQGIGYREGSRVHWYSGIDGVGEGFVMGSKHCFVGVVNLLLDVRSGWWWCYCYRFRILMERRIIVDVVRREVRYAYTVSLNNVWCQVCIGLNLSLEFYCDSLTELVDNLSLSQVDFQGLTFNLHVGNGFAVYCCSDAACVAYEFEGVYQGIGDTEDSSVLWNSGIDCVGEDFVALS